MMSTKAQGVFLLFLFFVFFGTAQSLVNNGSFEYGGPGLGFWIDGQGYNPLNPPFSGSTSAGNYAFTENPNNINSSMFLSIGDHTTGQGKMMVIDGTTTGGQQRFWKAGDNGGGICNLLVGETYYFSYWIHTVSNTVSGESELADIGVFINNASNVSLVYGTTLAPLPNFGWNRVSYSFVPNNSCVNIELYNNNTNFIGNDFAIDDIKLNATPGPLDFTYSTTPANCSNENSGAVVVYPEGGFSPYYFQLEGPQALAWTNDSGVFLNLPQGNYTIRVWDDQGDIDSLENIVISSVSDLQCSVQDTAICPGDPIELVAFGGEGIYSWNSSNPFESGFPNNQDTVVVAPLIETTYTFSSQVNNVNLVSNGNFENGNTSFASQYTYFQNNSQGQQRAYSVRANPNNMFEEFEPCIDHTLGNGTGKMMVLDGSTYNIGNDAFWCQGIAVEPNKDYTFSYWSTSLTPLNTAQIRVEINGVSLGAVSVPNQNCSWGETTYSWNSGVDTLAQICLYDVNFLAEGNDFAIDDISFEALNTCNFDIAISIATNNPFYDIYFPEFTCTNEGNVLPELGPLHTTGGVYNSSPSGLNINPLSGEIQMATSGPGDYLITYTAEVCGVFVPDTFNYILKSPPQIIELSGGQYNCVMNEFDSLVAFISGEPTFVVYYSLDGTNTLAESNSNPISLGILPGLYHLDSVEDNFCQSIVDLSFFIDPSTEPVAPSIAGDTLFCVNALASPLSVENQIGEIRWYNDSSLTELIGLGSTFVPTTLASSELYVTQTLGDCEGPATLFNISVEPCGFIIPSAFTPNNDGDNDVWNIQDIDLNFPLNQVRIYNRWGEKLFESIQGNYSDEPWDGKYKESALPAGSYYYVILFNQEGIEDLNGVVTILNQAN